MKNEHRAPWECVLAKEEEGECRRGEAPASDRDYFEILCLCLLQAGLNWGSIRKHWPRYREGFLGFDVERLAEADADDLLGRPGVIKNRRKVEAVIHNAREFRAIAREHGSFSKYLESLAPLAEREKLAALAKRVKSVGPETADYYAHSVGVWE
jgi:DNA-3-methyladenine glycosylase I